MRLLQPLRTVIPKQRRSKATMATTRTNESPQLAEAKRRLAGVSAGLAQMFPRLTVAELLLGCGVTLLLSALGRDKTADFLHELAQGVEDGAAEPGAVNIQFN